MIFKSSFYCFMSVPCLFIYYWRFSCSVLTLDVFMDKRIFSWFVFLFFFFTFLFICVFLYSYLLSCMLIELYFIFKLFWKMVRFFVLSRVHDSLRFMTNCQLDLCVLYLPTVVCTGPFSLLA